MACSSRKPFARCCQRRPPQADRTWRLHRPDSQGGRIWRHRAHAADATGGRVEPPHHHHAQGAPGQKLKRMSQPATAADAFVPFDPATMPPSNTSPTPATPSTWIKISRPTGTSQVRKGSRSAERSDADRAPAGFARSGGALRFAPFDPFQTCKFPVMNSFTSFYILAARARAIIDAHNY